MSDTGRRHRAAFRASRRFPEPHVILALSAIAADTYDEAIELSSSAQVMFRRMRSGVIEPVPSPAEAAPPAGHLRSRCPTAGRNRWVAC